MLILSIVVHHRPLEEDNDDDYDTDDKGDDAATAPAAASCWWYEPGSSIAQVGAFRNRYCHYRSSHSQGLGGKQLCQLCLVYTAYIFLTVNFGRLSCTPNLGEIVAYPTRQCVWFWKQWNCLCPGALWEDEWQASDQGRFVEPSWSLWSADAKMSPLKS